MGHKVTFDATGVPRDGYLALPASGTGSGVLVLHAWWGLIPFFRDFCDRLAQQGFVAVAPDLHFGETADTIPDAEALMAQQDESAVQQTAQAALAYLKSHDAVTSDKLVCVGFSMGTWIAITLDDANPESLDKIVLFYGGIGADYASSSAQFLGHFGESDDWEPIEEVRKMHAPNLALHIYPKAAHWFFENNRPEYDAVQAELAWERTLSFLRGEI